MKLVPKDCLMSKKFDLKVVANVISSQQLHLNAVAYV